jgi:enoyl-CoA hydratase/carnithine racemase
LKKGDLGGFKKSRNNHQTSYFRIEEFFRSFNRICLDLYTLPRPTVAALTGHTVAGGFILASCCDYRFMA